MRKDYQCAKWVVNQHAIKFIGQAMELNGGTGFGVRNPLTRLYIDVKAGPYIMQPYSPIDAHMYDKNVVLGAYPAN